MRVPNPTWPARKRRVPTLRGCLVVAAALLPLLLASAFAQEPPPADTLFAVLESALEELPKDRLDLGAALARMSGGADGGQVDAATVFAWVRDETGYVPYRGALRGPAGVLMDRVGNALDRATLLRALLQRAGYDTVLVHGTLEGEALERATGALRVPPDARAASAQPSLDTLAERAAATLGMDAGVVGERLALAATDAAALERAVTLATERQSEALFGVLGGVDRGAAGYDASVLGDHWWVQVAADGGWLDLDPTLPDAAPGDTLTDATLRFDLTDLRQLAAVDGACTDLSCGDRLHRVTVRVIAETWDGETLSEHEVLATELLAAEAFGKRIGFATLPVEWPEDLDLFGVAAPVDALREALLAVETWEPVLTVGDERLTGLRVSVDGTVGQQQAGGNAGAVGGLGGGVGGMFGGFGGGGGAAAGAFTALWLEVETVTPTRGSRVERRQVFDLIGPAARSGGVAGIEVDDAMTYARTLALAGETELMVAPAAIAPEAASFAAAQRLLAQRDAWTALFEHGATADPAELNQRLNDMAELVGPLTAFAQQRAADAGAFLDAALVVAYHRGLDAALEPTGAFDLIQAPTASLVPAEQLFEQRLVQGVRDTVLEAELQRRGPTYDMQAPTPGPAAVAEAFAADIAAGRAWRLVSTVDELDAVAPDLPADLAARVRADLDLGLLAVVPEGGHDAVGWWRIDPWSGATLGMGDLGWGQAMTDYAELTNIVLQLRTVINQYAAMAQCLGLAVTMPLRGETGVDAKLAECVFNLVCGQLNTALNTMLVLDTSWTNVIISATLDALWGGVPESGFGGFCGAMWKRMSN